MAVQRMGTGQGGGFSALGKIRTREVSLDGLEELNHIASKVSPKVANRLSRNTVNYLAGQLRNAMRKRAPKDKGTLRKAIHVVRRRGTPVSAVSDVRVGHGRGARWDAWYWHFIEFGTIRHGAQPFIQPTIDEFTPQMPAIYRKEFGRRLEKQLEKEALKLGVNKR